MAAVQLLFFLIWWRQGPLLVGRDGLTPAPDFLRRVTEVYGGDAPLRLPTLFWLDDSDAAMGFVGLAGMALALAAVLGRAHALAQAVLWVLVVSVVNVGQDWYGYAWETLLCEASFLAVFLAPPFAGPGTHAPARPAHWLDDVPVWLFRWLTFRVLFGAGAIKLRGDACWVDLTCLDWHFETQPNPHPLSWWFHAAPVWVHRAGVLFNHVAELLLPWLLFGPRIGRRVAAVGLTLFQLTLLASGNLAFLNALALVIGLSALDDGLLDALRRRVRAGVTQMDGAARGPTDVPDPGAPAPEPDRALDAAAPGWRRVAHAALLALVTWRSAPVLENLFLSDRQVMNASYDPLHLVNTYGAFGSVGRERHEAVIEGTPDDPADPSARWEAFELPYQPGDPLRRPCWITPYHLHLDWQMWFVPLQGVREHPWLVTLLGRLLEGDPLVRAAFEDPPFAAAPPRAVRVRAFRYRFTRPGEDGWWVRTPVGMLVRPITREELESAR